MPTPPAPLRPAYAFWGEDRPKLELALRRLAARVQAEGGLPPERFAAAETPAEAVVGACEALALSGLRLVIVEGADAWKAPEAAPLVAYLADPNPATCLMLVAGGAPTPKLVEAVQRVGITAQYGPDPKASRRARAAWFVTHLTEEVARRGGTIPSAVARQVVERVLVERGDARRVGLSAMELASEAAKLVAYAGDEPIDAAMVRELVPAHPDARTYELADAIAAGDARRAYRLLQDLATGGDPTPAIVVQIGLARHYRVLAAAQDLGPGASTEALTEATGVRGYPAQKALEQARTLPAGAGHAGLVRLAALEMEMRVSALRQLGRGPDDGERLVLELAVRDLLRSARGGGHASRDAA